MSIFQTKEYLELFALHFAPDINSIVNGTFEILPDKRAVLLGMKPVLNGQEITDYGDISDPSENGVAEVVKDLKTRGVELVQFDYIRESSLLFQSLTRMCSTPPIQQEVSPFILLPTTWDDYLESLERTDRKELKRKIKRLETVPHRIHFADDFDEFINLHKLSDHSKEQFMTDPMKLFFKDLLGLHIPGWQQKLAFLDIEGKSAAAIFYFENDSEILLYNSGYDPAQKFYSAGLLLVAELIKKSIEEKKQKFDFLRGNERYKYDLGATDERLFRFLLR